MLLYRSLQMTIAAAVPALVIGAFGCSKKDNNPPNSPTDGTHFSSGNMAGNGATFSVVFTKVEDVPYHCIYHSGMTGVISVSAASGTPTSHAVGMGAVIFIPATLSVHVNDTVKWTNGSGVPHTVTSIN